MVVRATSMTDARVAVMQRRGDDQPTVFTDQEAARPVTLDEIRPSRRTRLPTRASRDAPA